MNRLAQIFSDPWNSLLFSFCIIIFLLWLGAEFSGRRK